MGLVYSKWLTSTWDFPEEKNSEKEREKGGERRRGRQPSIG